MATQMMIEAHGLDEALRRDRRRSPGSTSRCRPARPRRPRAERRRQDDRGADPDHAARCRTPARRGSPATTSCARRGRAALHRRHRAGRDARRAAHRPPEPRDDRTAQRPATAAEARARAGELLEQFDLTDAADRVLKGYSGGMRRRLDLAAGLVTRPPVLFLDEPTTGLDPTSRVRMWDVIRELVADGDDAAADDPVPRRGRRARRPDRRRSTTAASIAEGTARRAEGCRPAARGSRSR